MHKRVLGDATFPRVILTHLFPAFKKSCYKACRIYHTCHIETQNMVDMSGMIATAPIAGRLSSR